MRTVGSQGRRVMRRVERDCMGVRECRPFTTSSGPWKRACQINKKED